MTEKRGKEPFEGGFSDHIERVVWKPIIWNPESPDQYPDGLPPAKPESWYVPIGGTHDDFKHGRCDALMFTAWQFGPTITVQWAKTGQQEIPGSDVEGGKGLRFAAIDLGEPILEIPVENAVAVVDALLYVYRRTREHEFEGPDAGLPPVWNRGEDGE